LSPEYQEEEKVQKTTALVKAFKKGDKNAFYELLKIYKQEIFKFCFRMLNNKHEAEDIAEDVFMKVFDSIHGLRDNKKFKSWLYKIAFNDCCIRLKKLSRFIKDFSSEDLPISDNRPGPEEKVMEKERQKGMNVLNEIVENAIDSLDPKYKQAVLLIHYQGLKYKEAAYVLDTNINTVKTWIRRGIDILREKLKPYKDLYHEM
jgi:RNA polymerase sigma-70 factor (ECF subfamily)